MPPEEVRQDEPQASASRTRRELRRGQFSLRSLLSLVGGISTLFSAMHWLPGLGGVLFLLFGWFVPAAAVLGGLILVQWPVMIVAVRLSHAHRHRLREERRTFLLPSRPR